VFRLVLSKITVIINFDQLSVLNNV